jgi:hypothetical protein
VLSYHNPANSTYYEIGTTVGVDDGKPLTEDQKRYKQAMTILSSEIEDKNMTLVELYTEKQAKYTRACAEKTRAFSEALEKATKQTKSNRAARQMYDTWVQENAKTWRNYVQAAYMEWVITGRKEEVEYWFSVVDQDSAMARIERSKVKYRVNRFQFDLESDETFDCDNRRSCVGLLSKTKMALGNIRRSNWSLPIGMLYTV